MMTHLVAEVEGPVGECLTVEEEVVAEHSAQMHFPN